MFPVIILIIDLYPYSPHSVKYLKNVFTSVFTLFLRKIILFLSDNLALAYSSNHTKVNPIESMKKYMDNDNYVCSVFIHLQKAFDTIDHQILVQKLYHYGIRGLAHNWFRLYLSNQQQFTFFRIIVNQMWSTSMIYIRTTFIFTFHQFCI